MFGTGKPCDKNICFVKILLVNPVLPQRFYAKIAAVVGIQDFREYRRGLETGQAAPVDTSVSVNQCNTLAISNNSVIQIVHKPSSVTNTPEQRFVI